MLIIISSVLVLIAGIIFIKSQFPKQIGKPPKLQSFLFEKPETEIPIEGKYIFKSASELVEMIKNGDASSVDIVKEHIAHIKNNNWKYNAIVWLREEEALEEARIADELVRKRDYSKPLLGVPVTVKEQFMVKGLPSTLNSKRFGGVIADKDAAIVTQIKEAGAIILGTTNLSLMVSLNETYGEIYPTGNNPFDTSLTCGGSTGGGAAALAAGFTSLSLGADAGGSIRIPASFCGVYGLKPSFDILDTKSGVMPFDKMKGNRFGLAIAGPLTRNAEDLKLYFNVLVGKDRINKYPQLLNYKNNSDIELGSYKISWIDEWYCEKGRMKVSKETKKKMELLLNKLKENGVVVKKNSSTFYDEMVKVWGGMLFHITMQDESWIVRKLFKMIINKQDNKSGNFKEIYKSLDDKSEERWLSLLDRQKEISDKMETLFRNYDFLILPLTYGPAFHKTKNATTLKNDDGESIPYIDYFPYTGIFNATGNPAIVIPMGLSKKDLPIGLQIVGPMYSDYKLIEFVKKVEYLIDGFKEPQIG